MSSMKKDYNFFFIYIIFTFNNIFFLLKSPENKIINWTSCGRYKVKGLKKITINSIKISLKFIISKLFLQQQNRKLYIKLKGLNKYKKIVLKQLKQLNLLLLVEENIIIHGGCKKKKKRNL